MLWFFNNIYDEKNHYLGIQKNVHFYRRHNNNHYDNFLFKFLYDNKNEDLLIKFESGKYESTLSYEQSFENEKVYNNDKNQISINKNIKDLELQNIKNKLYELIVLR